VSSRVFVAPNAREGLAQVRAALGDDAVVLSTRPHPQGVEILASTYAQLVSPAVPAETTASARIFAELTRLRGLLQNQLAGFAWSAIRRRDPARIAVLQTLFAAGFGGALARTLAARLPRGIEGGAADRWVRQVLIRNLPVLPAGEDPLTQGGAYALVGSTGSGKTTTLAKLAARSVDRYGSAQVALVAADAYRVGAAAQLRIYADLLGVGLHVARDAGALADLLPTLAGRRLVLVDTAGFSPTDVRAPQAMCTLDALGLRRLVVASAGQQGAALEQAIVRFGQGAIGCILSKLDEAPQPGAALDSLIRHRLPLAYIAAGQRVPEDLHRPQAAYLVDRALRGGQLATPYALAGEDWPVFSGADAERHEAAPDPLRRHVG